MGSNGYLLAKVFVSFGIVGASMVAAIVVSVAPGWSLCELMGVERSMSRPYSEAKFFYNSFFAMLLLCAVLACIPNFGDTVKLNVQVEILNAFLMPFVVLFLYFL